jgi:pimeloyl-ACP methyl ester carboxylesterase
MDDRGPGALIARRRIEVAGIATRYLETDGPGPEHPVLFLHGNPTNADDWPPFFDALAGRRRCLAPDLPGWGESDRAPGFRHTMDTLASFVEDFLDALGVQRFDLVTHDWGGVGLIAAQRRPAAVGRIVVMNTVPLLPGYRWHWVARIWRTPRLGEAFIAAVRPWGVRLLLRLATPRPGTLPEVADRMLDHWDAGTRRAVLELYRDADPDRLAAAGGSLNALAGPSLVLWGDRDPYLGPNLADEYGAALGGEVTVEHVAGAGHWPWLDRPEVVTRVRDFVTA